ncbi:MAG TPA: AraC family transcriptional regulator [Candidatus Krumholzibacteria bacterium]|nr:AraC family transcriptional regulator [Candidatus Krumholzibacteria bacterium]
MPVTALPEVARGRLALDGCVAVETVHESAVVQVVLWHCLCEGDALLAERCHSHHVLAVSLDGACQIHDGPRRIIMDPATAVFHQPGSAYRTTHPYGCNDTGISIAFRDDVARDVFRSIRPRTGAPSVTIAMRPMRIALQQMVLALRQRDGLHVDPVAMDEVALEMLAAAAGPAADTGGPARSRTRSDHRDIADSAREYLNAHFRENIRLDEIAREVGASPFHLSRIFRRHTGVAIRGYLHRLRLGAAMHALAGSDAPITRIALDTGFSSHAHLTALFARELGVPPSHVRGLLGARPGADLSGSPLFARGH